MKISHGHSIGGLHEQSSLSSKVILEKSSSLLENPANQSIIHMLTPQYIEMTMVKREEKKPHLIQTHEKITINVIKMQTQFVLPVLPCFLQSQK